MTHDELVAMLLQKGYETGWALLGAELTVWELDEDPPTPLKRPKADETRISS
jgi:hypothetical protein